jgi:exonuclease SbcD
LFSVKILHTADIHLDAPYRFLGTGGSAQRLQVKNTFERVCRIACEEQFDLLLVSGDLFDSNNVSERTSDWLTSQLKTAAIPTLICPGTHDCLAERSVYRDIRVKWPSNVRVFTDDQQSISLPEMEVAVHARANAGTRSSKSPIEGLRRMGSAKWEIAMAHGSVIIPGKVDSADFPITKEDIGSSQLDYIALGHWHSWGDYSAGGVKAVYPGAPEPLEFGGGPGAFAAVTLDDHGVTVEKREVGLRKMSELSISVAGMTGAEDLRREIAALASSDLALRVILTGLSDIAFQADSAVLQQELAPGFFFLEIVDRSHPSLAEITGDAFPERLVIGKFIRGMAERIEQARGDEELVGVLEDAMRVGVAVLQGRRVF